LKLSHEGFELRSPVAIQVTILLSFVDVRSDPQMQELAKNKGILDISACGRTRCRRLGVKGSRGRIAGVADTVNRGRARR